MRKSLLSMLAIVAMLILPGRAWADVTMTFSFVDSKNAAIEGLSQYDSKVSVYSQGESVGNATAIRDDEWNFTGSWTLTFDDAYAGKTVSYETSYGQRGTFTVTQDETVKVQLMKLTVTVKDTEDQPVLSTSVSIYMPNGDSNSYYTDDNGTFVQYFAAGEGYRWRWGDQSGTFDLTDDYALSIIKQAATSFNLTVGCRYGDYPVRSGNVYLYKYGETDESIEYFYNGSGSRKLEAGDYWLRDEVGVFSEKITVNADMSYWLEYHKVTFTSATGDKPNVGQQVRVYSNYDPEGYNNYYKSSNTNDKGEVTMYLQAGTYTYSHLGSMAEFTVNTTDQDQTVAIKTSSVTITLDCSATAAELAEQTFRWAKSEETNSWNYTNVQPEGKIITISPLVAGNYKLVINGMNTVEVEVAEGENNKTVKLNALQFTTNIETTSYVYVNEGEGRFAFNKKYYLTTGDYTYGISSYGEPLGIVNLTADQDIPLNYGVLTVTVKDSKGVVEGQYVTFGGRGGNTDENGKVTFTQLLEPTNKFTLEASDCYVEKEIILVAGDNTAELTIPDNVTFNVLHMGKAFTANALWVISVDDQHVNYRVRVNEGVGTARLNPALTYRIEDYHGTTTIKEGSTLSLGKINITTEGDGIALPMENWDAVSTYNVVVGSNVRLAAIPVSGSEFQGWDINGTNYDVAMVDMTITDPETTAKAKFGEASSAPTQARQLKANASFSTDGQFVYLQGNIEGTAQIFTFDGKLMKRLGVIGDRIGIYDLPTGAYLIKVTDESGTVQVGRVLKD